MKIPDLLVFESIKPHKDAVQHVVDLYNILNPGKEFNLTEEDIPDMFIAGVFRFPFAGMMRVDCKKLVDYIKQRRSKDGHA